MNDDRKGMMMTKKKKKWVPPVGAEATIVRRCGRVDRLHGSYRVWLGCDCRLCGRCTRHVPPSPSRGTRIPTRLQSERRLRNINDKHTTPKRVHWFYNNAQFQSDLCKFFIRPNRSTERERVIVLLDQLLRIVRATELTLINNPNAGILEGLQRPPGVKLVDASAYAPNSSRPAVQNDDDDETFLQKHFNWN